MSLLPSSTEIVCALGAGPLLVGRSHECDFPASVLSLPALSQARIEAAGTSLEIDREVRALVERALSVYRVDAERLRELAPDLILTQTLCAVCAVTPSDLESALRAWTGSRPRILSLEPARLDDVWRSVALVAEALDVRERGRELLLELRERVDAIAKRAAGAASRPRVACIEWIDPLMAAGNWMPELVELAGGRSLFAAAGEHSPWIEWDALREADPDVVLALPCGFSLERTRCELEALRTRADFAQLRAVRSRRVFALDGNQYFNRPGPRLVESLEILVEILHPELFDFGHAGQGWQQLA